MAVGVAVVGKAVGVGDGVGECDGEAGIGVTGGGLGVGSGDRVRLGVEVGVTEVVGTAVALGVGEAQVLDFPDRGGAVVRRRHDAVAAVGEGDLVDAGGVGPQLAHPSARFHGDDEGLAVAVDDGTEHQRRKQEGDKTLKHPPCLLANERTKLGKSLPLERPRGAQVVFRGNSKR